MAKRSRAPGPDLFHPSSGAGDRPPGTTAAAAGPPIAADGGESKRIAIVGAGIAGLVAAHELEGLGHQVEIFEAAARIGGRVHTHRFGTGTDAPFVELGAMRIPAHHTLAMRYITRLGLADRKRPFKTLLAEADTYLRVGAGYTRVRDAAEALVGHYFRDPVHSGYRRETLLFAAWLTTVIDAIAPSDLRRSIRADLDACLLGLLERTGVHAYLSADRKADLHAFFQAHPEVRSACSGALRSFLGDILTETSSELVQLSGGMGQLVDRLAATLDGLIRRRHEVVGLNAREHDVLMTVRRQGRVRTERRDYVLCTMPFSVLRRIHLQGIDSDKLAAIRGTVYCPATKVAFLCREPFWSHEGITGGASFSAGLVRQTYYPAVEGDPRRGAALLASYTIGDDADRLAGMTAAVRHETVRRELGRMHPELLEPGMVLDAVSLPWGRHRWSAGGCAIRWDGDASTSELQRMRAARPQNRLFFAGEHCSSKPAWIDGAIESALTAVGQIAQHRSGTRTAVGAG
ncbi:flavin monoamine oxidase family protein [Streptomyces beigongshangae]|uniref:flavin monoamine oxidase family protein n=1 Tax=Streptomyces beigongshangae TaxID=2841597 RepID=UPI001C85F932|nr:NAD(P)/FAD-dependent oxidoreductase [Streptomyces sp. REN17]